MKTVGEILKKARIEKKLTHEDIEKQIKIRKKFLVALEENAWNRLPSLPYIKGFIRNYSTLLGLKPEEMVAIFRRQFSAQEKAGLIPDGVTHPLDEPVIRFTPANTAFTLTISFIILFLGYLFFQYQSLINPPLLEITKPLEGEKIASDTIIVEGKTDRDAVISINNQKIAINDTGGFSITLNLPSGINIVLVESTSKYGKKTAVTRTIQVNPQQ